VTKALFGVLGFFLLLVVLAVWIRISSSLPLWSSLTGLIMLVGIWILALIALKSVVSLLGRLEKEDFVGCGCELVLGFMGMMRDVFGNAWGEVVSLISLLAFASAVISTVVGVFITLLLSVTGADKTMWEVMAYLFPVFFILFSGVLFLEWRRQRRFEANGFSQEV